MSKTTNVSKTTTTPKTTNQSQVITAIWREVKSKKKSSLTELITHLNSYINAYPPHAQWTLLDLHHTDGALPWTVTSWSPEALKYIKTVELKYINENSKDKAASKAELKEYHEYKKLLKQLPESYNDLLNLGVKPGLAGYNLYFHTTTSYLSKVKKNMWAVAKESFENFPAYGDLINNLHKVQLNLIVNGEVVHSLLGSDPKMANLLLKSIKDSLSVHHTKESQLSISSSSTATLPVTPPTESVHVTV